MKKLLLSVMLTIWLFNVSGFVQAQAEDPTNVIINNVGISNVNGVQQLNVYFTPVDSQGRAVPNIPATDVTATIHLYEPIEQDIEAIVQKPTDPLYVMLVLDRSGSMGASFENMRQAAISAVNASATNNVQFAVSYFAGKSNVVISNAFTSDKSQVSAAINAIPDPENNSGTCLYDALQGAVNTFPLESVGRRTIVVFTDGVDQLAPPNGSVACSASNLQGVIGAAQNATTRVPIYAIGLGAVNADDLGTLSASTGGVAFVGTIDELIPAFSYIFQSIDSQLVAIVESCLPTGVTTAVFTSSIKSGEIRREINNLQVTPNVSCLPPTATPTPSLTFTPTLTPTTIPSATPDPLRIAVNAASLDPGNPNNILIEIKRTGIGDVALYRVTIEDARTNFEIPLPVETKLKLEIQEPGARETLSIPLVELGEVEAFRIIVRVFDASGEEIGFDAPIQSVDFSPNRTATPTLVPSLTPSTTPTSTMTPTATLTPTVQPSATATATVTPTPTPTPIAVSIAISGIGYNRDTAEFLIDLSLANVDVNTVRRYTVSIQKDGLIRNEYTREGVPASQVTIQAIDPTTQEELPESDYTLVVSIEPINTANITFGENGLESRSESVTKPAPPAAPSLFDNLVTALQDNFVVILAVCGGGLLLLLLFFLFTRLRGRGTPEPQAPAPQPLAPNKIDFTPADATTGVRLDVDTQKSAIPQLQNSWTFALEQYPNVPYYIGNGGKQNKPVNVDLNDETIEPVQAYIYFVRSYNILNEGKREIYVNDDRVKSATAHAIKHGDVIKIGKMVLNFVERREEGKTPPPAPMNTNTTNLLATITVEKSSDPLVPVGTVVEIHSNTFTVGRSRKDPQSDIYVNDANISRQHLTLEYSGIFTVRAAPQNNTVVTALATRQTYQVSQMTEGLRLPSNTSYRMELGQNGTDFVFRLEYPASYEDSPTNAPGFYEDPPTNVGMLPPAVAAPTPPKPPVVTPPATLTRETRTVNTEKVASAPPIPQPEAPKAAPPPLRINTTLPKTATLVADDEAQKRPPAPEKPPVSRTPMSGNSLFSESEVPSGSTRISSSDLQTLIAEELEKKRQSLERTQAETNANYSDVPERVTDVTQVEMLPTNTRSVLKVVRNLSKLDDVLDTFAITLPRTVIGRGGNIELTRSDVISREHFILKWDGELFSIMDVSTNGTFLFDNNVEKRLEKGKEKLLLPRKLHIIRLGERNPVYLTFFYQDPV